MPKAFHILCIVISTCIIVYAFYVLNEKLLVNLGIALLGVMLASFFRRLCDFVEALFQFEGRSSNNNKISELFANSFSGFLWRIDFVVIIIDAIACAWAKKFLFEMEDLILLVGGISVIPLMTHYLKLDGRSDPAYTLAFNYNITYLEKALSKFQTAFPNGILILLFWSNYEKGKPLSDLDSNITKTEVDGYEFPVYELKYHGNDYIRVIHFAEEPLETLKRMCGHSKELRADQLDHQVESLYNHVFEILSKDQCRRNKCLPILISKSKSLENGGLVEQIMSASLPPSVSPSPHFPPSHPVTIYTPDSDENSPLFRTDEDAGPERNCR